MLRPEWFEPELVRRESERDDEAGRDKRLLHHTHIFVDPAARYQTWEGWKLHPRLVERVLTRRRRASPAGTFLRGTRVNLARGFTGETGFPPCPSVRGRTYHPAMAHRREAEELLMIEEADAWFEYLEATRGQTEPRYREVEPWAYARLSQRLRAVRTKRAKLRPAAAA